MTTFLIGLTIGILVGRAFEIWVDWYMKNQKKLP